MHTLLNEAIAIWSACDHTGRGTIANPGRLEGETFLTVYCDTLEGEGCGGENISPEGADHYESLIDVDSEMREELELGAGYILADSTVAIYYQVSSVGFVTTEELTEQQVTEIQESIEAESIQYDEPLGV